LRDRRAGAADVVGYSRLAEANEDRTLTRLRCLRRYLIDPAIEAHHGRIVKRTGPICSRDFVTVPCGESRRFAP
jgi:class 3 adenylate cyclase